MDSLFPKRTALIAAFLTFSLILGLIMSLREMNEELRVLHKYEIPLLELSAINVRLSEKVSADIKYMVRENSVANREEYELDRDALNETIQQYLSLRNHLNLQAQVDMSTRAKLLEVEGRIFASLENRDTLKAREILNSEEYAKLNEEFVDYFRNAAESLSLQRDEDLGRSSKLLQLLVTVSAAVSVLICVLWYYIYLAYKKNLAAKQEIERQLEEERIKAVQVSKMSTLGEMAGGVAHEINNPLAIIRGYVEGMQARLHTDKLTPEYLEKTVERLVATVERAAQIVSGLRAFARDASNDPIQPEKMDLVLQNAFTLTKERFVKAGVDFRQSGESQFLVECRAMEISQVIINLLNNSFDAIQKLPEKWVEVSCNKTGHYVEIRVIDSGKGIPKDIAARILEPFFTTKDIGKGTGLGLSIAAGIVKAHNGELYIDEKHPNTCFVLRLPLVHDSKTENSQKLTA